MLCVVVLWLQGDPCCYVFHFSFVFIPWEICSGNASEASVPGMAGAFCYLLLSFLFEQTKTICIRIRGSFACFACTFLNNCRAPAFCMSLLVCPLRTPVAVWIV